MKIYKFKFRSWYGSIDKFVNSKDDTKRLLLNRDGEILIPEDKVNHIYENYDVFSSECVGELFDESREAWKN